MSAACRAGKRRRRVLNGRALVAEGSRCALLHAPACASGRRHASREPVVTHTERALESDDVTLGTAAPMAGIHRTRRAHHDVGHISVGGIANVAQLDHEQAIMRSGAVRRIHLRPPRAGNPGENPASPELLTQRSCRWSIRRSWELYFDFDGTAVDAHVASPRRIENTDSVCDDTGVDGDRPGLRTMLRALAPDAARDERTGCGGTASQREKRKVSKEIAHRISGGAFEE